MIVSKKSIGLIVLFLIPLFAIGQNSVDSIVAKQDSSMAIGTDSLCSRSVCICDTVQHAAASYTSHHFYHPIVLAVNEFLQMNISLYHHRCLLFLRKYAFPACKKNRIIEISKRTLTFFA